MPEEQQQHILTRLDAAAKAVLAPTSAAVMMQVTGVATVLGQAHDLISRIHKTLDGKEWDSDTAGFIADLLTDHGLDIRGADDESGMTADELAEKYAAPDDGWGEGEHPAYPRSTWRMCVTSGSTLLGYWDWVVSKIEQEG